MAVIQFVQNYDDLSTDRGYQFKFHCDKCGNGFLSSFEPSIAGTASSLLRAAGDIFGGILGNAGNSAYEIQRAVAGKGHDSALGKAVQEGKQHFLQCKRCGHWVCPDVCWNAQSNQCTACAPELQGEIASAQAQAKADAARQQLNEMAQKTNYTSGIDMSADSSVRGLDINRGPAAEGKFCGNCGVQVGSSKFCPNCGVAIKVTKPICSKCGFQPSDLVKFCPECGNHM